MGSGSAILAITTIKLTQPYLCVTVIHLFRAEIDSLLKGKWDGMKAKLVIGDVEGALGYFVDGSVERYRGIFNRLGNDKLQSIFSSMSHMEVETVRDGIAECGLVRNENGTLFSYPATFVKDSSGIWRIYGF